MMARPVVWVSIVFMLACLPVIWCQKKELDTNVSEQQQSIDEVERREGKPQDSGNGKDTQLGIFMILYLCKEHDLCGFLKGISISLSSSNDQEDLKNLNELMSDSRSRINFGIGS